MSSKWPEESGVARSTAIVVLMTLAVVFSGLAQWAWSWDADPPFVWSARIVTVAVAALSALACFAYAIGIAATSRDRDVEPRPPPDPPAEHSLMGRVCAEVGHSWMDLALGDRMCRNCGKMEDA